MAEQLFVALYTDYQAETQAEIEAMMGRCWRERFGGSYRDLTFLQL